MLQQRTSPSLPLRAIRTGVIEEKISAMIRTHQVVLLAAGLVSTLVLHGCTASSPRVRTGMSLADYGPYDLKPGDPAPDFVFVGGGERLCRFSAVRGGVTVVVSPVDAAWPNCATGRHLAELADSLSGPDLDVVAVSVAQPSRPAAESLPALQECQIAPDNLVTIFDQHDRIRGLYGPQAAGRFYVVGNVGQVSSVGVLGDLDDLRAEMMRTAHTIYDQDYREAQFEG